MPGRDSSGEPRCRFCATGLVHTVVDLGMSPLCECYLGREQLDAMEPFYPLHVRFCHKCFLVQVPEYVPAEEIFTHYAYFSSYSDTWLKHAECYAGMITDKLELGSKHLVVEVGSNDGYLLQYFVAGGVPVLGIEPAANVAAEAQKRGIRSEVRFFGAGLARDLVAAGTRADLIVGNNVLAQVPDLNDFVSGIKILLNSRGTVTLEFPHLARMIEQNQFDTIYHEHYSYFSLLSAERILARHGLAVFDVEELSTHGGSLRVYARHEAEGSRKRSERVAELARREVASGYSSIDGYADFARRVSETKWKLLGFLIQAKNEGRRVVGYGAPGKGNTLLNYCGIRTDLVEFTVDRSPHKQGKFLPGTHIPIFHPEKIRDARPDYVLILPWNLKDEVMAQMSFVREWGGRFVVPIPEVAVQP